MPAQVNITIGAAGALVVLVIVEGAVPKTPEPKLAEKKSGEVDCH
jgi:hypothetical protein